MALGAECYTGAMSPHTTDPLQADAEAIFSAAVAAAQPGQAVARALRARPLVEGPVALFALGKAAAAMAAGAVDTLGERRVASGVLITPVPGPSPHPALLTATGNHPVPGPESNHAAEIVADAVAAAAPGDVALVLLSGGTSSLVGAPADGVDRAGYETLVRALLRSGVDIAAMNAERRRVSRWGGGRLARALAARGVAAIRVLLVSDVVGDDPAVIGSGPCFPDADDDPAFRLVTHEVVAGNRTALDGAARRARELGYEVVSDGSPLTGEASGAGDGLAKRLLRLEAERRGVCLLAGGETTVALGTGPTGSGGRAQELSLAAARVLAQRPEAAVLLLAAGTDGRDGPTDAAGAVVTPATWAAIRKAGFDPAQALTRHAAYPALDGAGALLRTGLTGTNVMDVVVGLVRGGAEAPGGSRARR